MKLWPFHKKSVPSPAESSEPQEVSHPTVDTPGESCQQALENLYPTDPSPGEYELVIPITPESHPSVPEPPSMGALPEDAGLRLVSQARPDGEPSLEPAESALPLLKTDLPRLHLVRSEPVVSEAVQELFPLPASPAEISSMGDLYGEAYDLPETTGVFENTAKPEHPAMADQSEDLVAAAAELPVAPLDQASLHGPVPVSRPHPIPQPVVTRSFEGDSHHRPSETPGDESIADALTDFERLIMWQDNQFLNKSINDLVDRYFAQIEEETGREAV